MIHTPVRCLLFLALLCRLLLAAYAQVPGTGSISGTVLDINGGVVPGAQITLLALDHPSSRVALSDADEALSRMIGSAILPSLLHQDPRYFYRGSGSKKSRAFYAISSAVICRGDNGRLQPNYSYVLGSFAAGGISNLYHPASDRGVGLTIGNGFLNVAAHALDNLGREFVFRKLTPKVPDYAQGKP
jgi:hypothetical protein